MGGILGNHTSTNKADASLGSNISTTSAASSYMKQQTLSTWNSACQFSFVWKLINIRMSFRKLNSNPDTHAIKDVCDRLNDIEWYRYQGIFQFKTEKQKSRPWNLNHSILIINISHYVNAWIAHYNKSNSKNALWRVIFYTLASVSCTSFKVLGSNSMGQEVFAIV